MLKVEAERKSENKVPLPINSPIQSGSKKTTTIVYLEE